MKRSTLWFGWTALMLPLHMSEQMLFGIGELAMIRRVLAVYYDWFQQTDYGTVLLVAIVGTIVCALTFAILVGGIWKELSLAVWSVIALGEFHHVIETMSAGHYTPGTATAIPYVVFGFLLMRAVIRERRATRRSAAPDFRAFYLLATLVLLALGPNASAQAPAAQDQELAVPSGANTLDRSSASPTATTPERHPEGNWQIESTSYLWLQGIHGDVSALGKETGFKASAADLASHAKVGMQELVGVRHKRFTIAADILWTPIEFKSSNSLLNAPPAILSKAEYSPVTITPEIGYRLIDNRRIQIDGLTGLRYWHVGANFTLAPAVGGGSLSKTINWVDPLVGARIKVPVSKKLTATIWGDAGGWGVGSKMDYQIVGAFSYRIKPKWALDAGYRYMYSDYSDSLLHSRIAQSGLFIGVTHTFKSRTDLQFSGRGNS